MPKPRAARRASAGRADDVGDFLSSRAGQAAAAQGHARRVRDAAQAAVRPVPPFTEAPRGAARGDAGVRRGRAAPARARVGGGALVPERGLRVARRARLARAQVRAGRRLGRRRGPRARSSRAPAPAGSRPGVGAHIGIATPPLATFGTEAQQARWLAPAIRGEKIAALAITEPDAGSDVAVDPHARRARRRRLGGQRRQDVHHQRRARRLLRHRRARRAPRAATAALSFLVVEAGEGVTARPLEKLGWHASDTARSRSRTSPCPRTRCSARRAAAST